MKKNSDPVIGKENTITKNGEGITFEILIL